MRRFELFVLTLLFAIPAVADDLFVVDAHRNIPLSDEDPIYKDYYINGGEAAGLKKNLVVTVSRKIAIHDSSGAQSYGDIDVPVGQLRVLAIYGRVAVAREYKLLSRDENPMLEQIGLMVGDKIDLKGAFVDSKAWTAPKRKVATEIAPTPARVAAAVVAAPEKPVTVAPIQVPVTPIPDAKQAVADAQPAKN